MASGHLVHACAAGLGLAAVLASSDGALTAVEICGAIYLLAAGVAQLAHRRDPPEEITALGLPLRRGFLTSVLNPKGAVFFLAFLPRFLPDDAAAGPAAFGLGLTFAALTIVIYGAYVLGADRVRALLSGPRTAERLNTIAGLVFIGFAAIIAVTYVT
jgi:threonine/homoserine/homoserine lactone efflux protein